MKRILYIILPFLLFASCEREIPYNGEYEDAKLVVEAYACAGVDSLTCFVGRSYFFLDSKPQNPEVPDDVTITLSASSGGYDILSDSVAERVHYLKLSRPLLAGDTLRLTVSQPQYGTAEAQEILVPDYKPQVLSTQWDKSTTPNENFYRVKVRLPQYISPEAFISVSGKLYVTQTNIIPRLGSDGSFVRMDTLVQQRALPDLQSADEMFAGLGNTYYNNSGAYVASPTLLFRANNPNREVEFFFPVSRAYDSIREAGDTIIYSTYSIDSCAIAFTMNSEAYDLYEASMEAYRGLNRSNSEEFDLGAALSGMIGVEEPAPLYCNITNGLGVFITQTRTTILLKE